MTAATPVHGTTNPLAGQPLRVLPEERFWQRYSPRQEMPLSGLASLALHGLGIGLLLLLAWMGWLGFKKDNRSPAVEPVRLLGDGKGTSGNQGESRLPGQGFEPQEKKGDRAEQPNAADPDRPQLDKTAVGVPPPDVKKDANDDVKRPIQPGNPDRTVFERIARDSLNKLPDNRPPTVGPPGPGPKGPGPNANITNQEKRMQRWSLIFETRGGDDYRAQLQGLGAILAIPLDKEGKAYKVMRNLSGRGQAQLLDEDVAAIRRIYWYDKRPDSVRSLVGALKVPFVPDHVVAFMPAELEDEMYRKERDYRGLAEEQIETTEFRVVAMGKGYGVKVVSQKPK
jgi:hypothetical protein